MLVCFILVNFDSSEDMLEAVASVAKSLVPAGFGRKIIVVENGSKDSDGEWERLQPLLKYQDLELIRSSKNLGFTGGNNLGITRGKELGADYFLLLNADTKVDRKFLVELVEPFMKDGSELIGVASPKIYFYPGFEFHKDRYSRKDLGKVIWYAGGRVDFDDVVGYHRGVDEVDSGQYDEPSVQDEEVATGCCMLIGRAVIDKIGGLDDRYFFSWEDTDFSMRAKRAGFKLVFVPRAVVWHKNANTSGGAGSKIQDFYQTRNRLIFAFRYASLKVKLLLLLVLLRGANWNRLKAIFSAFI